MVFWKLKIIINDETISTDFEVSPGNVCNQSTKCNYLAVCNTDHTIWCWSERWIPDNLNPTCTPRHTMHLAASSWIQISPNSESQTYLVDQLRKPYDRPWYCKRKTAHPSLSQYASRNLKPDLNKDNSTVKSTTPFSVHSVYFCVIKIDFKKWTPRSTDSLLRSEVSTICIGAHSTGQSCSGTSSTVVQTRLHGDLTTTTIFCKAADWFWFSLFMIWTEGYGRSSR